MRKGALEMLVIIITNIIIIIILFDAIPALAEPSIGVFSGVVLKSKIFGKTVSGDNRYWVLVHVQWFIQGSVTHFQGHRSLK